MVYKFRGYRYFQKELTAEEFFKIKEILSEIVDFAELSEASIAKIVDKLQDTGKLEEIFNIILIPKPNIIDRIIKKKYNKRYLEIMSIKDIAKVITDFFVLNFSWLGNLQDIVRGLG